MSHAILTFKMNTSKTKHHGLYSVTDISSNVNNNGGFRTNSDAASSFGIAERAMVNSLFGAKLRMNKQRSALNKRNICQTFRELQWAMHWAVA